MTKKIYIFHQNKTKNSNKYKMKGNIRIDKTGEIRYDKAIK